MKGNPGCWFEIYVQDMERAKTFYQAVFGTQLARLESPNLELWAFPGDQNAYGSCGALVKMEGMPSGGNSTIVYFSSADCAVEAKLIEEHGGQIERQKMSIGQYGHIVLAYDTEGNLFGVHSMT